MATKKTTEKTTTADPIAVSPPKFQTIAFKIRGNAPLVQNAFPQKAMEEMMSKQAAGNTAKKGKKHEPKDFDECYRNATHTSQEGWAGIPAPAFRNALVDVCRMTGFHMTKAKMSIFVFADGYDAVSKQPLVKITKGKPYRVDHYVRIQNTVDIRSRPMFDPGWEATLRVMFDADQFTEGDVANLLVRVGMQNGIGEGRAFSKNSCGMGWGSFEVVSD